MNPDQFLNLQEQSLNFSRKDNQLLKQTFIFSMDPL